MAYHIDGSDGDIVIDGFEKGIGDSPYSGLTDMRSMNPASIAGEASVAFSNQSQTSAPVYLSKTVTPVSTAVLTIGGLIANRLIENFQAVYFTSSTIPNIATNVTYFITGTSQQTTISENFAISATYGSSTAVLTGTSGTATMSVYQIGSPKYFAKSRGNNFVVDSLGQIWSDLHTTTAGTSFTQPSSNSWTYMGNQANSPPTSDTTANGNGLLVYETVHDATGGTGTPATADEWLFSWRNAQIDYAPLTLASVATTPTFVYGWKPSTATLATQYLQTRFNVNNSHMALITPDSRVNYCDANYLGNFYQNIPSPGSNYVGFNPLNATTYTFQNITALVPPNDIAQCLAFSNQYLLLGGQKNIIYPWDMNVAHNTYSVPLILLPERNVVNMVTIGQNTYIFAGNRGNIYLTNGTQANFYKKLPDHLSGAEEPLFAWGGATYNKMKLYFGCNVTFQNGSTSQNYGGIWCIDTATNSLFNAGQLSYGTYAGYATALGVNAIGGTLGSTPGYNVGYGLLVGWDDGTGTGTQNYGVDASWNTPYTGGQSYVTSDALPVGTLLKPTTPAQVEFKLTSPLLTGESVELQVASALGNSTSPTFTSVITISGDGTKISGNSEKFPVQNMQWLLVKAITTSIGTNPSYVRLREMRVIGATIAGSAQTAFRTQ